MIHDVALSFLKGIGARTANTLASHFGTTQRLFDTSGRDCREAGMNARLAEEWPRMKQKALERAKKEIDLCQRHKIGIICRNHPGFPASLACCADAPTVLYYKGSFPFPAPFGVAIVGTRRASLYGKGQTEALVEGLRHDKVCIVSGLALGIDTRAHASSLACRLPTWAVLAHGLEQVYPSRNLGLAREIVENGGTVLSEMPLGTPIKSGLFPRRNRIIAGLSNVTVIAESSMKGGAMHTVYAADSYQRGVFAIPHPNGQEFSEGGNFLIKTGKAVLLQSAQDIRRELGLRRKPDAQGKQGGLFDALAPLPAYAPTEAQRPLTEIFRRQEEASTDQLQYLSGLSIAELLPLLLQLEMAGVIKTLPGNRYKREKRFRLPGEQEH